jgi:hypothetical protein
MKILKFRNKINGIYLFWGMVWQVLALCGLYFDTAMVLLLTKCISNQYQKKKQDLLRIAQVLDLCDQIISMITT